MMVKAAQNDELDFFLILALLISKIAILANWPFLLIPNYHKTIKIDIYHTNKHFLRFKSIFPTDFWTMFPKIVMQLSPTGSTRRSGTSFFSSTV